MNTRVPHYEWKSKTLLLRIKVQPKASKDSITGLLGDRLKVCITAPPVEGKANAHLIRFLAKLCNVPKANVEIVSGQSGRQKSVAIRNPKNVPEEFKVHS